MPWASRTLRAACTRGGSVVAMDTMATAGSAAKVVLTADRSAITADGKDLSFIMADVRDANGVLVPTADNSITFAVSGPAALVGVDNGNPIDDSSYKATSRKAFSGKALAIVRSTAASGTITITATASGLTSTPVTVTAD